MGRPGRSCPTGFAPSSASSSSHLRSQAQNFTEAPTFSIVFCLHLPALFCFSSENSDEAWVGKQDEEESKKVGDAVFLHISSWGSAQEHFHPMDSDIPLKGWEEKLQVGWIFIFLHPGLLQQTTYENRTYQYLILIYTNILHEFITMK